MLVAPRKILDTENGGRQVNAQTSASSCCLSCHAGRLRERLHDNEISRGFHSRASRRPELSVSGALGLGRAEFERVFGTSKSRPVGSEIYDSPIGRIYVEYRIEFRS